MREPDSVKARDLDAGCGRKGIGASPGRSGGSGGSSKKDMFLHVHYKEMVEASCYQYRMRAALQPRNLYTTTVSIGLMIWSRNYHLSSMSPS